MRNNLPLVSVIIPCRDEEKYIEDRLRVMVTKPVSFRGYVEE